MNMQQRLDDIAFITQHLVVVLQKENRALHQNDIPVIEGLIEEKDALCRAYEQRALVLSKYRDELKSEEIPSELLELVKDLGAQVEHLIQENSRLLRAAIEANRRVMSLVAEAVKGTNADIDTYGATGNVSRKGLKAPADTPVSIDRSL